MPASRENNTQKAAQFLSFKSHWSDASVYLSICEYMGGHLWLLVSSMRRSLMVMLSRTWNLTVPMSTSAPEAKTCGGDS